MATTITGNWGDGLDPATKEIFLSHFVLGWGSLGDPRPLFTLKPGDTLTDQVVGYNPPSQYTSKTGQGNDIVLKEITQGHLVTATQTEFENGFAVSSLMRRFIDPAAVARFFGQMGEAAAQKFVAQMWSIFTGGFTDIGPEGGSITVFDDAHTTAAGTWDNLLASSLDDAALSTARALLKRIPTEDGMVGRVVDGEYLIVRPEHETVGRQLMGSEVTSDQMQTNTHKGSLQLRVTSHIASGTSNWFLAAGAMNNHLDLLLAKGSSPEMRVDANSKSLVMDDTIIFTTRLNGSQGLVGSTF